jgi:SAM-dependent methyltransferase
MADLNESRPLNTRLASRGLIYGAKTLLLRALWSMMFGREGQCTGYVLKNEIDHRILARVPGLNSEIIVYERNGYRSVYFKDGLDLTQGKRHWKRLLDYTPEYLQQLIAAATAVPRPERVLVLGLGIGAVPTLLQEAWPDIEVDAVEIDPGVFKVAQRYFGLRVNNRFRVHLMDALEFVTDPRFRGLYDLVYVDCFDAHGISPGCESESFYQNVGRVLRPDGALISNLVPGRRGALEALCAARLLVTHPWAIGAPSKSNWTLVGSRKRILDIPELVERARKIDEHGTLPFALATQFERARPSWELISEFADQKVAIQPNSSVGTQGQR